MGAGLYPGGKDLALADSRLKPGEAIDDGNIPQPSIAPLSVFDSLVVIGASAPIQNLITLGKTVPP